MVSIVSPKRIGLENDGYDRCPQSGYDRVLKVGMIMFHDLVPKSGMIMFPNSWIIWDMAMSPKLKRSWPIMGVVISKGGTTISPTYIPGIRVWSCAI